MLSLVKTLEGQYISLLGIVVYISNYVVSVLDGCNQCQLSPAATDNELN
jgi:hypothetical protein